MANIQPLFDVLKYGQSLTTLSERVRFFAGGVGAGAACGEDVELFKGVFRVACLVSIIGGLQPVNGWRESTLFDLFGLSKEHL